MMYATFFSLLTPKKRKKVKLKGNVKYIEGVSSDIEGRDGDLMLVTSTACRYTNVNQEKATVHITENIRVKRRRKKKKNKKTGKKKRGEGEKHHSREG